MNLACRDLICMWCLLTACHSQRDCYRVLWSFQCPGKFINSASVSFSVALSSCRVLNMSYLPTVVTSYPVILQILSTIITSRPCSHLRKYKVDHPGDQHLLDWWQGRHIPSLRFPPLTLASPVLSTGLAIMWGWDGSDGVVRFVGGGNCFLAHKAGDGMCLPRSSCLTSSLCELCWYHFWIVVSLML